MLLTELPAHPVHPGPDSEGEDEIHRIFQRADQRLAEESHHGHHNGLARQKGEQIAFLVKIRDTKGQMQERYHFINEGIWQENEAEEAAKYFKDSKKTQPFKPGDIKLRDLNGDYIIDDKDETYLGSQSPKWTGGFNNNFSYKDFDLNVYIIARWGQMIDYELTGSYDPQGKGNFPAYLNYWTPENPSNDFPRPAQTNFYNYLGYQTLNYIDGSYWKIKTVSLGYTFPKSLTSKLGVSKLRAYVTANNLFSFAKNHLIQDYDAERGGSAKAPLQRQFIFGLNLDF